MSLRSEWRDPSESSKGSDPVSDLTPLRRSIGWLYRGVRWRVIGLTHKAIWIYRGVRWRIVGRIKKAQWFVRRRNREVLGLFRRAIRPAVRRVRRGPQQFVAVVPGIHRIRLRLMGSGEADKPELRHRDLVALRRRADQDFDDLCRYSGLPAIRSGIAGRLDRYRTRRQLFRTFKPSDTATSQYVDLELRDSWDAKSHELVSDARIVICQEPAEQQISRWLRFIVPVLLSGRPVVFGHCDGQRATTGRSLLGPHLILEDLLIKSHIELAHVALTQFRALFVADRDGYERVKPRVSVVLSTLRAELVQSAVDRISAQEHVDVDLHIGLHGFGRDELSDFNFSGGAITSCSVEEFDSDVLFGDVLQELSISSSSSYVAKCDDDDHYGPHHLIDLLLTATLARSPLTGKAAEFVALESAGLLVRRRGGPVYSVSRFLAGGALLISRDALVAVGGWGHVRRGVDQDLISRFETNGLGTFRTHGYEFVHVRHGGGHTWDADNDYFIKAASEIWSISALPTTGVRLNSSGVPIAKAATPDDSAGVAPHPPRLSATLCVPNMNNQDSVALFERGRDSYTRSVDLVICDDRSDPPLAITDPNSPAQIVRAPIGEGFGAGRSRHKAAEVSEGEILIFADADISISDEAICSVLQQFDDGFVGAIHANVGFSRIDTPQALMISERSGLHGLAQELKEARIPGQGWRERHWAASADLRHPRSSTFRAAVGAFVAIDRASYERTGGFRDVVVRGVEDTEFGYRLLASGCEQRLYRGDGITHLGERTFSQKLAAGESSEREKHLSAFIPIWSRSLSERQTALSGWDRPVVHFATAGAGCSKSQVGRVRDDFGEAAMGTTVTADFDYLRAPFALCYRLDENGPRATGRAHDAFRNKRCGDVVVLDQGREIAHFVALWALNLARVRDGEQPVQGNNLLSAIDPSTLAALRRDFSSAIVSL